MGAFGDMMRRAARRPSYDEMESLKRGWEKEREETLKTINKSVMNKYTFKSGAKVEGTVEQILKTAKALGETVDLSKLEGPRPAGYYVSKTHGLMKLNEMAPTHIRNAIVARSKEVLETIRKRKLTDSEFLNEYLRLGDDETIVDLFTELKKKVK